jgi:hypothetical protein
MLIFSSSFEAAGINTGCSVLSIYFELDLFPKRWWEETTGVRRSIVRAVAAVEGDSDMSLAEYSSA